MATMARPHGHQLPCPLLGHPVPTPVPPQSQAQAGGGGTQLPSPSPAPSLPLPPTQISLERLETGDEFKVITITF